MKADEFLINLLRLNGKAIGHARLQREAYLLTRCGGQLDDVAFIYLDGGPFSTELADALEVVREGHRIEVGEERTRLGIPYWAYNHSKGDAATAAVDGLTPDEASKWLRKMSEVSDLVLELAAAYVFIRDEEHYGDGTMDELMLRKPLSARNGSTEEAVRLIRDLGL